MNDLTPDNPSGEFLLYQTEDGQARIECRVQGETLWLSLNQIATLFESDNSVIFSKHLKKFFKDGELEWDSVVANHATTAFDGKPPVECRFQDEMLWLSQTLIANLKIYTKYLQAHTGKVSLLTKKSVKESCKRILTKAKKVSAYPPSLSTMLNSGGFFCA